MLAKRIIPCLDIDNALVVKGVNFLDIQNAGDPLILAKNYSDSGADELVFLDITATTEKRKTMIQLVRKVAKNIFIPFTVGGGISSMNDAKQILRAGADKVSINSAAVKNSDLISELANCFGSQCVVIAVDVKKTSLGWEVFINAGKDSTGITAISWVEEVVKKGAGEILITSIDNDGTKKGFTVELIKEISEAVSVPIIASGGAGKLSDFYDVFTIGKADGALAASLFHFQELSIQKVKKYLTQKGIPIRD